MITQQELKRRFVYDPETGIFLRLSKRRLPKVAGWIQLAPNNKYRRIQIAGRAYMAHVLAFLWMTGRLPDFPREEVDHRDHDGLNNSWSNLRLVTKAQNQAHHMRRRDNASGYMGVYRHSKNARWCAHIREKGKLKYLGSFKAILDAVRVRDEAALRVHGEYAKLNGAQ